MILPAQELMPIVCAALQRGQRVRLTATGSSMHPFIRDGEVVEIAPLEGGPAFGAIVLARTPGGRYVIHRVVRVWGCSVWLRGDAQLQSQGPLSWESVLGQVITTNRQGRAPELAQGYWRLAGCAWTITHPIGVTVCLFAGGLRRAISKACRWGRKVTGTGSQTRQHLAGRN
jgi:hypothetical protein